MEAIYEARDAAWDEWYEELLMVFSGNGGVAHVKQTDPERWELGRWCNAQARILPRTTDRLDWAGVGRGR